MVLKIALPLALGVALAGCRPPPRPMDVRLQYRPTDDVSKVKAGMANALGGQKVAVKGFVDQRAKKDLIAQNVQRPAHPVDVTSKDDAGAWCAQQLKSLLEKSGVEVVEGGAKYVLAGKVSELFVTEGEVYEGQATLLVDVTDAAGKSVWSGAAVGRAKRWGRDFSEENYMEALSDAYSRALEGMFTNADFLAAVKRR